MEDKALGMVENLGLAGTLAAADAMLRAAPVELVGKYQAGNLLTVLVRGSWADVQTAVRAGTVAAQSTGCFRASQVLSQPVKDIEALFQK